ncbi:glycosyltransferase family 4 protein [Mucilaginibacter achroorhodeus]|nr:glycosyltransferase family 1 protein [Mucilaginibacter achroorhodeus]
MNKIRVAFFAEILAEDFDGAVRTMYQIISRIDTSRFEYLFIYGAGPDQIGDFQTFRVPHIKVPLNTRYSLTLPGRVKPLLSEKLKAFAPQVIHISTPSYLGSFALEYAQGNKLPVLSIYHTHFISYVNYYFKFTPFLIKPLKDHIARGYRKFYNRCDKVYVPSTSIQQELTSIGLRYSNMQLWKRGIDTQLFNPLKRDKRVIERLTGNRNPTIVFASRLVWEKNLETLIAIYEKFKQRNNHVNFLVVGDGVARKDCEKRMKGAFFTGKVDHIYLASLYASADVFLFPSISETYGNVVAEAMASGLPCVIADGGGSKDFVEHGKDGFRCRPFDADDYVEKLEILLNNKPLAHHFATECIKHMKELSWDALAQTYFDDVTALAERTAPAEIVPPLKPHAQLITSLLSVRL